MSSSHHHLLHVFQEQEPDLETLDYSNPSCSNTNTIRNEEDNGDLVYAFDFDALSPPTTTYSFSSHPFRPFSDSDSDSYSASDTDDQMNFITDLFASRGEEYPADDRDYVSDPFLDSHVNFRVLDGGDGLGSDYVDEQGLGLGLESELSESSVTRRVNNGEEEELGLGFGSRSEFSSFGANSSWAGLRVVGIESDSDSEGVAQDVSSVVHEDTTTHPFGDSDIPLFWDCLGFEEQRTSRNEELAEWEEVEGGRVDERESLSSVMDRIEELSVSSEVSSNEEIGGEEFVRSLEWEILLAVNNLGRSHEFDHDGDIDGVSYLAVRDGYVYEAEYDAIFGQFVQSESALKGSPPASKAVVESLPSVVLTEEQLQENHVVCAVCKDEILVEETVTRLPCCHHYHCDCIVPWLSIRNTCPVCRYELPTDDLDYEQRKNQRGDLGLPWDLQMLELI